MKINFHCNYKIKDELDDKSKTQLLLLSVVIPVSPSLRVCSITHTLSFLSVSGYRSDNGQEHGVLLLVRQQQ